MNGKHIKADKVITGHRCLPETVGAPGKSERVARAVLITTGSVVAGNTDAVSAICIPPNTVANPGNINVLCFSSDAAACPKGKCRVPPTTPPLFPLFSSSLARATNSALPPPAVGLGGKRCALPAAERRLLR